MKPPGPRDFIVNSQGQPSPVMAAFMRDLAAGGAADTFVRPEDFTGDALGRLNAAFGAALDTGLPVRLDGNYVITTALDALSVEGTLVVLGEGNIHVADDLTSVLEIEAEPSDAVSISAIAGASHAFPGTGTGNTTSTKITAAGHGAAIGDLIKIFSEDAIAGGTSSGRRVGEFAYVADVDDDDLYVAGSLTETYTTSPRLVIMRKAARLVWDGPTFSSESGAQAITTYLTVRGFVQPRVRTGFRDAFSVGLFLSSCYGAVCDVECLNMLNRVSSASIAGYALQDTSSWHTQARVGGIDARHAYTTVTNTAADSDPYWKYGRTRGAAVTGTGMASSAAAFDAHSEASDCTFYACSTSTSRFGEDASGAGFQVRGRRQRVVNCVDQGSANGLQFEANAAGDCVDCEAINFSYEGPGDGIRIGSSTTANTLTRPRVQGGLAKTPNGRSIALWKCAGAVIEDMTLAPTGSGTATGVLLNGDAEVLIRSLTVDLSGYTGTDYRVVSFAASSTGNSVIIERLRITGASGKLAMVFNGASTSGTAIMAIRENWLETDAAPTNLVDNVGSMTLLVDGQSAPTWTAQAGQKVWAYAPDDAEDIGWVYTASGNWKAWGAIAA